MKKFRYIILTIIIAISAIVEIEARSVTYEEIPNNSYVIGEHLYTVNIPLTTRHIMLASQTIEGHTLSDMEVYYKTSRGKWISGLTGEEKTHLSSYTINYEDKETTSATLNNNYVTREYSKEEIPNNSYIIGEHLYTVETPTTIKHIMLASQTIEGHTLSDMKVYYKTSRGIWKNGLTGETITVPNTFKIGYVDLEGREKEDGYVNLEETSKEITYGTESVTFNIETTHGGRLSVKTNNNLSLALINGNKVIVNGLSAINAGTEIKVTVKSAETDEYTEGTAIYTITINKATLGVPVVSIDTDGVVTWNNITGASKYEVSFDNINYEEATSGNISIPLTSAGVVTAYVKAIPTSNYITSENAYGSASVNVYKLSLTKDEGINKVTGSGRYVSGKTINIKATLANGYVFSNWEVLSGNTPSNINNNETTVTLTQNTSLKAISRLSEKLTGYVTLDETSKEITYGTESVTFNVASSHGGTLSVSDDNDTSTVSISGNKVTVSNLNTINAGTEIKVAVKSAETDEYTEGTAIYTITINKATLGVPVVSIDTNGNVTWTSVTGASGYRISFDNINYTELTIGSISIPLTTPGIVTAYVKAIPTSNYITSENAYGSASVNVYSLILTKDEGIESVSESGNYVSGKVVTINTTPKDGYRFSNWSVISGDIPNDINSNTTTVTLTQNTSLKAISILSEKLTGYVTLEETSKEITYGTNSVTFNVASSHGGTLSVSDDNDTSTVSISGNKITVSNLNTINAGTEIKVTVKSAETDEYTEGTAIYTITINKATLGVPVVSIDTNGVVTWNNVTGVSRYEISFDTVNWVVGTSGVETIPLTNAGLVTAYVKAIPTSNYITSENAYGSASVNVYSLILTKDEGIESVSGSGNYVSDKVVTISAELKEGYEFASWVSDGDTLTDSSSLTTSVTITQNTSIEATSCAEGTSCKMLHLRYNGNGGTWNNPVHDVYDGTHEDGFVREKNGEIFEANYSPSVDNINLVDYNAGYFNWRKSDAGAPPESEYYIVNKNTNEKTYLNQMNPYSAEYLANASGCNLLNTNCTVVVYVNWEQYLITDDDYLKTSGTKFVKVSNDNGVVLRGFNLGEWLSRAISLSPMENAFNTFNTSNFPSPFTGISSAYWREYADNDVQIDYALYKRFGKEGEFALNDVYYKNFITESDIDEMEEIGINLVRVPLAWSYFVNIDYQVPNPEPTITTSTKPIDMNVYKYTYTMLTGDELTKRLKYLDWIVHECRKRGIYVIFDLHVVDGGQSDYGVRPARGFTFYDDQNAQDNAIAIWKIVSRRFNGNPGVAGYELLNEPSSGIGPQGNKYIDRPTDGNMYRDELIRFYDMTYKAIRDIDPDHIIIMEAPYPGYPKVHQVYLEDSNHNPLLTLPTEAERTNGINDDSICPATNCKWTNVAYSLHDYFKTKRATYNGDEEAFLVASKAEIAAKVDDDVSDMRRYNVPIYIGETNFTSYSGDDDEDYDDVYLNNIWSYALSQYDNKLLSYTIWSYKVAKDTRYGMVYNVKWTYKDESMALLLTDDYDTILNKWSKTAEEAHYDYATQYVNILKDNFINKSNKPLFGTSSYTCSAGGTLTSTIKIFSRDGSVTINDVNTSDSNIAEVSFIDPTGVICTSTSCKTIRIKCKSQGSVTLTARASNGVTATSNVTVSNN